MFNGKIHYKWQFSIAMLVHQRVSSIDHSSIHRLLVFFFPLFGAIIFLLVSMGDPVIPHVWFSHIFPPCPNWNNDSWLLSPESGEVLHMVLLDLYPFWEQLLEHWILVHVPSIATTISAFSWWIWFATSVIVGLFPWKPRFFLLINPVWNLRPIVLLGHVEMRGNLMAHQEDKHGKRIKPHDLGVVSRNSYQPSFNNSFSPMLGCSCSLSFIG